MTEAAEHLFNTIIKSLIKSFCICVSRVPLTHLRRSTSCAGININSGRRHVARPVRPVRPVGPVPSSPAPSRSVSTRSVICLLASLRITSLAPLNW